jgi:hypothetical protein
MGLIKQSSPILHGELEPSLQSLVVTKDSWLNKAKGRVLAAFLNLTRKISSKDETVQKLTTQGVNHPIVKDISLGSNWENYPQGHTLSGELIAKFKQEMSFKIISLKQTEVDKLRAHQTLEHQQKAYFQEVLPILEVVMLQHGQEKARKFTPAVAYQYQRLAKHLEKIKFNHTKEIAVRKEKLSFKKTNNFSRPGSPRLDPKRQRRSLHPPKVHRDPRKPKTRRLSTLLPGRLKPRSLPTKTNKECISDH